jgi:hypothetical protein
MTAHDKINTSYENVNSCNKNLKYVENFGIKLISSCIFIMLVVGKWAIRSRLIAWCEASIPPTSGHRAP